MKISGKAVHDRTAIKKGCGASFFFSFFFRRQNCKELKLAAQPKTQPKVHVLQNHMPDTQSVNSVDMLEFKHTVVLSLDLR